MDWSLEEAWKRTDDIIESVQQQPPPLKPTSCGEKSLQEKLYDIYVEECEKEPEAEGLRSNVNLLEKLMKREPLPCLVVSLYPENQGYSLMLKDKDGVLIEPYPGPYVGQKLLEYLDAEELPSFLIDILEKSPVNVFHSGCVIAEIRDYRQCGDIYPPEEPAAEAAVSSPACQVRHILLRPTMQSLVSDVESMTSDSSQWTQEAKLELESQLILATAEPLCLDPSVAVTCTANKLLFNEKKIMIASMKKSFMGHDWSCLDLEEEKHACTSPPDVATMIACRKRAEIKPGDPYDLKIPEAGKCVDTWKQKPCELVAPSEVDVQKYAKGKQSRPHGDDSESTAWPDDSESTAWPDDSESTAWPDPELIRFVFGGPGEELTSSYSPPQPWETSQWCLGARFVAHLQFVSRVELGLLGAAPLSEGFVTLLGDEEPGSSKSPFEFLLSVLRQSRAASFCHWRDVQDIANYQSVDVRKRCWVTFCSSEWPTFNVGWPRDGTFDINVILQVKAKVMDPGPHGHPDQVAYIVIWEAMAYDPPPWVKPFVTPKPPLHLLYPLHSFPPQRDLRPTPPCTQPSPSPRCPSPLLQKSCPQMMTY
ncbi:transcription factor SPT20 homolog [Microtus oregoni]|uniref:transcription factor SPT20 homolog n=2 Tax=Microtus oregoni TaxID=111838 RepID=UPI001BB21B3B|nr:transcription factor SPT20 homolog [Microtus oregoni]